MLNMPAQRRGLYGFAAFVNLLKKEGCIMDEKYSALFTPWKIGNVEIKNRLVMCSMGGTSLFGWMEPCHFDKEAAHFLLQTARDDVGLILPGMQWVRDVMGNRWLYTNKRMFEELKEYMVDFHKTGAKLFVQLAAGCGRSMGVNHLMSMMLDHPALGKAGKFVMDAEYLCASASPTPNRWKQDYKSRPLTVAEIKESTEAFGKTARLLREAGVDGVEIHAVHEGYTLDQFAIKNFNYRTDEYGGSLDNRLRYATDIVKNIKNAAGSDFPVSLRYSVVSKTKDFFQGAVPGEEFVEFGRDMAESEIVVKKLQDAGYDMLNCDNGTYDAWYWAHPPQYMPNNCNLAEVEHIKNFCDIPVVCAGKMEPEVAAREIAAGKLDAVAIARQNLVDPEWVHKLQEGREEDIKPCIRCHNGCFNFAKYKGTVNLQSMDDTMHLARCALTPPTMQHNKYKIVPTTKPKKVAIIGGGIGGMECALMLTKRGHKPVLFEKTDTLGGLFITASSMSFKENDKELIDWYRREIVKAGVEVRYNTEINDIGTLGGFDEIIVATGSVPRTMPIPGFNKCMTLTELLREKKPVGDKVVIFGGGQSGCEAALELVLEGKHPIVVEYAVDLIATPAVPLPNASYLREALVFHKVPIYLESTISEIKDGSVVIKGKDGSVTEVECDNVVNAIGFVPTPVAKPSRKVHLVGDCVSIGNLRTVIWRAWDVCMKI